MLSARVGAKVTQGDVAMRQKPALIGMVLAVILSGCGGDGPVPPGPEDQVSVTETSSVEPLPDPCTLVTTAEASTAVAAPVSDGVHELVSTPALGSGRSCTMKSAGRDGAAVISTFANPGDLWEPYKLQESQFGPVKDLAGVGDKAFTVGNGACHVVKGGVLLEVVVQAGDGYKTDPEPRMIVLCTLAAGRLSS